MTFSGAGTVLGGVAEFAVSGDLGTDVFRRVDAPNQRRYRYECVATVDDQTGLITAHSDFARKHPERIRTAAIRFRQSHFVNQPIVLGTPATYPSGRDLDKPIELFLYLDFFRMWQIAEQEIHRMSDLAGSGGSYTGPEISSVLRLLLDFNQLSRAENLIDIFLPALREIAHAGQDDKWQNAGFSLRMIGDLRLRAGRPADALSAYELSLLLGDNPHRRGLAIRAAHAAQARDETMEHLRAYERQWPLPEPLAEIRRTVAQSDTGA